MKFAMSTYWHVMNFAGFCRILFGYTKHEGNGQNRKNTEHMAKLGKVKKGEHLPATLKKKDIQKSHAESAGNEMQYRQVRKDSWRTP